MKNIYTVFIALLCFFLSNSEALASCSIGVLEKDLPSVNSPARSGKVFDTFREVENDPEINKEIAKAVSAFAALAKNGNFTQFIDPNELKEFPVGLSQSISNVSYDIVVTKAKFTPSHALINVYARLVTPQIGTDGTKKELYFGAEDIKLSYNGKIIGDAKLSLLGDANMPFNQNQWMLTLEGGTINKSTGASVNDNTYVTIDCDGIKELSLKGNLQISRNLVVPIAENGDLLSKMGDDGKPNRVKAEFAVKASDWNDLLVKVKITPFAIASQVENQDKGYFSFFVNDAILDLSDLRTDAAIVFPQYYHDQGYLIGSAESWRGLYVQSLRVGLPQEFKTVDHINSVITFEAQNLLIDSYGISGSFSAKDVIPLEKGITSVQNAWKYSLDLIAIDLAASKLIGANIKGRMQLPIQMRKANDKSNISFLQYEGMITEDEYLVRAGSLDEIEFDIWSAKANLYPGSYLELRVKDKRFLPKVVLSGSMTIGANADAENNEPNSEKSANFSGVVFRDLVLQTQTPFITAAYFGSKGEQKLGGFPVSIKNIYLEAGDTYANLGLDIAVQLQENRFSATGKVKINGEMLSQNNSQQWKYKGFTLSEFGFKNVDVGVATISGSLEIMGKDPLYGNGFTASLDAKLKGLSQVEVKVSAVFGYSTFRYWGFEGSVDQLNIPAGAIDITGFTGAAFYRMKPDAEMSKQRKDKALVMTPDHTVGLALRAGVYGKIQNEGVASFMAGFNISTNPNGGLANIAFMGEAVIMGRITDISNTPFTLVQSKFREMTARAKFAEGLQAEKAASDLLNVAKVEENYPLTAEIPKGLYGKLAMNYDFNNSTFHANLDVYVNVAGGVVKGLGQNGRAGWAVLHIASDDWYLHIGTPTDMIGLKVGFGSLSLKSGSYFMVGSHIPASPPPPNEVAQILGLQLNDLDYMKDLNTLKSGKGFAFGSHLSFDTGDMTALFLYARFQAGLGADIMLKNYGEAKCSNRGGAQIGINGWYANGQAYAYLQGELGIRIKLWFINKKIPIVKAGAAALLQAKGPNPYWARGYLGGYYNLLGGMIKGSFRFKLEFGEECKLENESVLGGMKIITDLSPRKEETNVDVFAIPQATFAMKVNEPFVIPEDDGDHTYKVIVEKMAIVDAQGVEIKGVIEYTNAKDVANFVSEDILPPNKTLKVVAQVSFMEKKGGIYETIMVNGQKAIEIEERTFTTGTAPTRIPLANIQYAYPVPEQENYYRAERNSGYIKLKRGQDYLFDDVNWKTTTQFANENNSKASNFTYDGGSNTINFTVPDLNKQKEYTFSLIAKNSNQVQQTDAAQVVNQNLSNGDETSSITTETQTKQAQSLVKDGAIERLTYTFGTSKYTTLADKLSSINFNPLWVKTSSDVVFLQQQMNTDEYFDLTEIEGSKYTDHKPLIQLKALMDDAFAEKFNQLLYQMYPIDGLSLNRLEAGQDLVGMPPVKALPIFTSYLQYLGSDKGNSFLKQTFPYKYDLFSYYKSDWYELLSKAADKYVTVPSSARPQAIDNLMQSVYGIIPRARYQVKATYTFPGGDKGSEKQLTYEFK